MQNAKNDPTKFFKNEWCPCKIDRIPSWFIVGLKALQARTKIFSKKKKKETLVQKYT